jgi:PAS domain S-box-containing protein
MQVGDFLHVGQPIPLEIFKLSVERAFNQIIITDTEGIILFANRGLLRITGYTPEEAIGKTAKLWGHQMPQSFYLDFWKCIRTDKKPFYGEIKNKRKNGEDYWAIVTVSPIIDHNNSLVGFIGTEEEAVLYRSITNQLQEHSSISTFLSPKA